MLLLTTWAGVGLFNRPARQLHPWELLLAAAADGEQDAFARFYDESSRLIYGVVLKILANAADAEEVTLDVYMQVWRQAADYNPERGSPTAWLITRARSRALDRLRSRQVSRGHESGFESMPDPADTHPAPEESAWASQQRDQLLSVMNELGPEQRTVIELAYYEGLSHSDMAKRLQLPLGTIKTRIRLAMNKLRQRLVPTPEVA